METLKLLVGSSALLLTVVSVHAQGDFQFQDLDFEEANPVMSTIQAYWFYPAGVTVASALPNWNVYINGAPQYAILPQGAGIDLAQVSLVEPGFVPGPIDGNYSVLIQSGYLYETTTGVSASLTQLGIFPATAQTMEFEAWGLPPSDFIVSINGNNLAPVALETTANYTLYAVDISAYAGQAGGLEFTVPFNGSSDWIELDDISFSSTALVPEPNIAALTMLGGLLIGTRKWFWRRGSGV